MVNTTNSKYLRVNSKTDSRNFNKDRWTLINHFPNEKNEFPKYIDNEYILTEWLMSKHWTTGVYYK